MLYSCSNKLSGILKLSSKQAKTFLTLHEQLENYEGYTMWYPGNNNNYRFRYFIRGKNKGSRSKHKNIIIAWRELPETYYLSKVAN